MAIYENRESWASWFSTSASPPDVHVYVHGVNFRLNSKHLIWRSVKLAKILKEKQRQQQELSCSLTDIPSDAKIFELAMKFCHGNKLELSADNVVPLACVAYYLEMTEDHCSNNLIKKTLSFFHNRILPDWNESVKALRTCEPVFRQATHLGIVDDCVNSIVGKARYDLRLLGQPLENLPLEDEARPSSRRKLFDVDWWFEDLTTLALPLYKVVMSSMVEQQQQHDIPPEYIAGSLFRYAKKRADVVAVLGLPPPIYVKSSPQAQREVIEAVERLLPDKRGALHCRFLFEMLRWAIALLASPDCLRGFQIRIGKQLEEATVEDLFIPCYGYSQETRYDVECVMKILKNFYANYTSPDAFGLIAVSELVESFLSQVSQDANLKKETFQSLLEMLAVAADQLNRRFDGIYRAIDVYFGAHRELTESEREELCQALDCHKLSPEAVEHAVRNERLPLRVVVQVLFVGQLQLRDVVTGAMPESVSGSLMGEEEVEEKVGGGDEGRVREDMEKMDFRVMELERECSRMKKVMVRGGGGGDVGIERTRKKESLWKEVKRKFGCIGGSSDHNNHVKKKKKK